MGDRPSRLLALVVAVAVAVAFADSSIVVLALPDLYSRFATSIVGVSWVVTSYNLVLAGCAFALILVIGREDVGNLTRAGLVLFCAGSVGAAVSWSLPSLIVFRCVEGAGAAMLIAGALAVLSALCGSRARAVAMWITRTRKSDPTPRDQHLVAVGVVRRWACRWVKALVRAWGVRPPLRVKSWSSALGRLIRVCEPVILVVVGLFSGARKTRTRVVIPSLRHRRAAVSLPPPSVESQDCPCRSGRLN